MIFGNIEANLNAEDRDIFANIKDKFDFSGVNLLQLATIVPWNTVGKLTATSSDLSALITERIKAGGYISLDEIVSVLSRHFGEDIKDVDFKNLNLSEIMKLTKILDIDYDKIKQFIKI